MTAGQLALAEDADEVRDALEHLLASETFRGSPQLAAFLRFVVESTLRGESARLKGYTIGVEAFGRPENFDPQIDPIVRVEATRLRRTLERYYAGPGASDSIVFEMTRGSYVPAIRRRAVSDDVQPPQVHPADTPHGGGLRGLSQTRLVWVPLAALAAVAVVVGVVAVLRPEPAMIPHTDRPAPSQAMFDGPLQPGNGLPTVSVGDIEILGPPTDIDAPRSSTVAPITTAKLRTALARFETANIIGGPSAGTGEQREAPADYRLTSTGGTKTDQTLSIEFRLVDTSDGAIVWSRSFGPYAPKTDPTVISEQIVRDLAMTLGPPYGVIRARERLKHLTKGDGDPRGRCLIETSESFRSFEVAQHQRARQCLELLTTRDPSFALGFSYLAGVYTREHQYHLGKDAEDPAILDRALRTARRGIDLHPESARAYQMLFAVLFAQRQMAAAFAAGEKAIALNPLDMTILTEYGGRLVVSGDLDRGMEILGRSAEDGVVLPSWHQFYLFLAYYMKNDVAAASRQAGLITADAFPLGLLAKALVAAAEGNQELARKTYDQLVVLRPMWRDRPREELARQFPSLVAEKLERDLAKAGLVPSS